MRDFFKLHNYTRNKHWLESTGDVGENHLLIDYNGQREKQKRGKE